MKITTNYQPSFDKDFIRKNHVKKNETGTWILHTLKLSLKSQLRKFVLQRSNKVTTEILVNDVVSKIENERFNIFRQIACPKKNEYTIINGIVADVKKNETEEVNKKVWTQKTWYTLQKFR